MTVCYFSFAKAGAYAKGLARVVAVRGFPPFENREGWGSLGRGDAGVGRSPTSHERDSQVGRPEMFCRPYGTRFLFLGAYPGLTSLRLRSGQALGDYLPPLRGCIAIPVLGIVPTFSFDFLAFDFSFLSNRNMRRHSRVFSRMLPFAF
jgi:hypothetical protein